VRSIAAYHGIRVSKNTLMLQGTLRFAYPYQHGKGFITVHPKWRDQGFTLAEPHAAAMGGIRIRELQRDGRSFAELWTEMKQYVANDEPVYVCFSDIAPLWNSFLSEERHVQSPHGGHCVVLVGYDEDRNVAIVHDNHWHMGANRGTDMPYAEYPLELIERSWTERPSMPPWVYDGTTPVVPDLADMLATQSRIILGTHYNHDFKLPPVEGLVTGYAALDAAGDDLEATAQNGDLPSLLRGFDRFLETEWWMGPDGQPARAAWLSGVAAATGNADVESAAFYLDHSATQLARARLHYASLKQILRTGDADCDALIDQAHRVAECFRRAAGHERAAGEYLQRAANAFAG
jgi:hypothetical protein